VNAHGKEAWPVLIKHSTRSDPSLSIRLQIIIGCSQGLFVKALGGSEARTKGNEGAPFAVPDTGDCCLEASQERPRHPASWSGADREHGGCRVEVNGCSPRKGTPVLSTMTTTTKAVPVGKMPVVPGPLFLPRRPSPCLLLLRLPLSFPSSFSSSSVAPRSAPALVGTYAGIGHSWLRSMMLAARI